METEALKGTIVAEHKRCGKPSCRCTRGQLHGPYYYRRWRDEQGRQRSQYVARNAVERTRQALEEARANSPRVMLRRLREMEKLTREATQGAGRSIQGESWRYWHGRALRERRSCPPEERDRATYRLNGEEIQRAVGWPISEDDFVLLQRMIRSERKRRNRLGLPWKERDPETGDESVTVEIDFGRLSSYRDHAARDRRKEVHYRGEAGSKDPVGEETKEE